MKSSHLFTAGLFAAALAGFAAPSLHAQTVTYTPGDLLLGFEEPGNTNTYVVDLGPATYFLTLSHTAGTTDITTARNLGNLAADLSTAFGTNWAANSATQGSNVQWGIFGASSAVSGGTDGTGGTLGLPQSTLFLTLAENNPGTLSAPPAEKSKNNQGSVSSSFAAFANSGFNGQNSTPNSSVASIIPTTVNPNWTSKQASSNAFGVGFGIEQPQGSGVTAIGPANSELDFYELLPTGATGNTGSGNLLGNFTLDSSANLEFTSAQAVPEPSTYAIVAIGAALLLMFRRPGKSFRA